MASSVGGSGGGWRCIIEFRRESEETGARTYRGNGNSLQTVCCFAERRWRCWFACSRQGCCRISVTWWILRWPVMTWPSRRSGVDGGILPGHGTGKWVRSTGAGRVENAIVPVSLQEVCGRIRNAVLSPNVPLGGRCGGKMRSCTMERKWRTVLDPVRRAGSRRAAHGPCPSRTEADEARVAGRDAAWRDPGASRCSGAWAGQPFDVMDGSPPHDSTITGRGDLLDRFCAFFLDLGARRPRLRLDAPGSPC